MLNKTTWILAMVILFSAACKNRKRHHAPPAPVVKIENDSAAMPATAAELLDFTLKTWTYFSSKVDIEFINGDDRKNFNASIRMYRDSLVWISAGAFGIEGVRILVNQDSVIVINKLDKTYSIYKTSSVKGITDIPLTVSQLQNIILARPVYGLELYSILLKNDKRLNIVASQEKFNTYHCYSKEYYTIDTTSIKDNVSPNYAQALYSDYAVVNTYNFPYKANLKASNGSRIYEFKLEYSGPDFETVLSFPFTIPSSYEKKQ